MEVNKKNGEVCFNEETHTYWNENDDGKYISVTTLIEKFVQPFDEEFWSAYKALEKLLTPEEWKLEKKSLLSTHKFDKEILSIYDIKENDFNKVQQDFLDEWEKNKIESCERGTKIHSELENKLYSMGANVSLKKFGIGGKFVCDKGRTSLDLTSGVYPEYLISQTSKDGILRIAGQIDLLAINGDDVYIIDHKTNKEIKTKGGFNTQTRSSSKMLYPLNDLDDCNFNHYQLQLSTYAWMIQKLNPKYNIKGLILNHYDHNGNNTIYKCEYLKDHVERMLRYYKKELIREKQKEKYKRIEY